MEELEIDRKKTLANIEKEKLKAYIGAIGKDTLVQLARAGPETQAKLLSGLGLKGFMIVDGKNPVNLFNTANGLIGNLTK